MWARGRTSRESLLDDQAAPGSILAVSDSVLAVSGSVLAMSMSCEQLGLPTCPLHSVVCHLLPAISLPHVNGLHNVTSG